MTAPVLVRGRFDGTRVVLLEDPPTGEPCDVTVEFIASLDEEERERRFRAAIGGWVDDRDTDEIIADIYNSRTLGREVPPL
jgi:hypothetical protein